MSDDVESIVGIPEPWGTVLHQHQFASALPKHWPGITSSVDQALAEAAEKGVPTYPRDAAAFVQGASDLAEWLDRNGWKLTRDDDLDYPIGPQ